MAKSVRAVSVMSEEISPNQPPRPSDQPLHQLEPRGLGGIKFFTEELKESLLRAKGENRAIIVAIKNGEWSVDGHVYNIDEINMEKDTVTLKVIRPVEPSEQKKELVKSIVSKLSSQLHGSIENAVESALLEKSDGELELINKGKTGKVTRRRGCFWLECDGTELLL